MAVSGIMVVMTSPTLAPPFRQFQRNRDHGVIAGVASGLADHVGVRVDIIRIAFVVMSMFGGLGPLLYAGVWMSTKAGMALPASEKATSRFSKSANIVLVIVALAVAGAAGSLITGISIGIGIALLVIAFGAILAWFAYDRFDSKRSVAAIITGAALVIVGVLFAALQWENERVFGSAVAAVLLTLIGVGALVVPFGLRMWEKFSTQREEKLLADERAEIANRLHDSVLQTLALIQKRADNPEEVQRLARGQERELRNWLFTPTEKDTLHSAINRACGEVEDMFGVRIAPVIVGEDAPLTDASHAAVLAAREAMVNSAKHAGVDTIDVYAENFGELSIYVRDRGPGFDPEQVPSDRHGVRDSIIGRMAKAGGSATYNYHGGTEVHITVPQ